MTRTFSLIRSTVLWIQWINEKEWSNQAILKLHVFQYTCILEICICSQTSRNKVIHSLFFCPGVTTALWWEEHAIHWRCSYRAILSVWRHSTIHDSTGLWHHQSKVQRWWVKVHVGLPLTMQRALVTSQGRKLGKIPIIILWTKLRFYVLKNGKWRPVVLVLCQMGR